MHPRIRHLVAKTSGRFTTFTGTVKVDAQDLAKSSVEVRIDAASINRHDFGIKTYPGVLGDDVEITLDIEAGK